MAENLYKLLPSQLELMRPGEEGHLCLGAERPIVGEHATPQDLRAEGRRQRHLPRPRPRDHEASEESWIPRDRAMAPIRNGGTRQKRGRDSQAKHLHHNEEPRFLSLGKTMREAGEQTLKILEGIDA